MVKQIQAVRVAEEVQTLRERATWLPHTYLPFMLIYVVICIIVWNVLIYPSFNCQLITISFMTMLGPNILETDKCVTGVLFLSTMMTRY